MRLHVACLALCLTGTSHAVGLRSRASARHEPERKSAALLSSWAEFFRRNSVSDRHVRSVRVNGNAWQVSLQLGKNNASNGVLLNTVEDVCQGFRETASWNIVSFKFLKDTMCFAGEGYETRARSVVIMLEMALKTLREAGTLLNSFDRKTMSIDDMDWNCTSDFAFALPWDRAAACGTVLVPDFTFWAWPEAGLVPDFKTIATNLNGIHDAGDAEQKRCGWAGDPGMNLQRPWFIGSAGRLPHLFEFVTPTSNVGTGGGRLSMETQAKRWACTIDLPARGYSGRVPLLLHSGRPMLSVERAPFGQNHFTDNVWYARKMIAGIHYLPVSYNLTNLEEAARVALSEQGRDVGAQAGALARRELTTEAAIRGLADILKGIAGSSTPAAGSPDAGGPDTGSPYVEFPR